MFIKANIFATMLTLSATVLAHGTITGPRPSQPGNCATGSRQCCQTLNENQIAGLVNTVSSVTQGTVTPDVSRTDLESLARSFAYACTSIGVNDACAASPVCCQFNTLGGMAAFGCTKT